VDKDGGDWQTAFFATSWVPIYNNNAANGQEVLQRVVDFFGGCQVIPDEPIEGLAASNDSPTEMGSPTTFTASVTGGTNIHFDWDFGDGNVGSGSPVEHTYAAPGSYEASVHAWNDVSEATVTTTANVM
jgi:PKD repeat protein